MSEPKAFASLSAGLLARKGAARPAMRPQLYNPNDDLGFNDMGEASVPPPRAVPVPIAFDREMPAEPVAEPPIVQQQAALAQAFESRTLPQPKLRAAPGSKGKSAFTLRLDAERHLKLRLIGAHTHRSAQSLVTEALDRLLAEMEPKIQ